MQWKSSQFSSIKVSDFYDMWFFPINFLNIRSNWQERRREPSACAWMCVALCEQLTLLLFISRWNRCFYSTSLVIFKHLVSCPSTFWRNWIIDASRITVWAAFKCVKFPHFYFSKCIQFGYHTFSIYHLQERELSVWIPYLTSDSSQYSGATFI